MSKKIYDNDKYLTKREYFKKYPIIPTGITCIKCGGWAYEGTVHIVCGNCNEFERYCTCLMKKMKEE